MFKIYRAIRNGMRSLIEEALVTKQFASIVRHATRIASDCVQTHADVSFCKAEVCVSVVQIWLISARSRAMYVYAYTVYLYVVGYNCGRADVRHQGSTWLALCCLYLERGLQLQRTCF